MDKTGRTRKRKASQSQNRTDFQAYQFPQGAGETYRGGFNILCPGCYIRKICWFLKLVYLIAILIFTYTSFFLKKLVNFLVAVHTIFASVVVVLLHLVNFVLNAAKVFVPEQFIRPVELSTRGIHVILSLSMRYFVGKLQYLVNTPADVQKFQDFLHTFDTPSEEVFGFGDNFVRRRNWLQDIGGEDREGQGVEDLNFESDEEVEVEESFDPGEDYETDTCNCSDCEHFASLFGGGEPDEEDLIPTCDICGSDLQLLAEDMSCGLKPCHLTHAPPPKPSAEKPLDTLPLPRDLPQLIRHARSNDAHLRFHAIEQLYLMHLHEDMRKILQKSGLIEICIETLARQHADLPTRGMCSSMIQNTLDPGDIVSGMHDLLQLANKGPLRFKKTGGNLKKLLEPYDIGKKSASEKYLEAYETWISAPRVVITMSGKKEVVKDLAQAMRLCKMGCAAACSVHASETGERLCRIYNDIAEDALVESMENLDAHLVHCFCEALAEDHEYAISELDHALEIFPDEPWLLTLKGQYIQERETPNHQEVVQIMRKAWLGLRKNGEYTMECYLTLLLSGTQSLRFILVSDAGEEALREIPIDDKRYATVAYMMACLHLEDLYHPFNPLDPNPPTPVDPVRGFEKYYKLGKTANKLHQKIWGGAADMRFEPAADESAKFLKKFVKRPKEERILFNNMSYHSKKKRTGYPVGMMLQCICCGGPESVMTLRKCLGCEVVRYCSAECQKLDWPIHKAHCKKL